MLKLKELRQKNKYSVKDVADITNIKGYNISNYENGKYHVPESLIRFYCSEFNTTPNEIFGYYESVEKSNIPLHRTMFIRKKCVALELNYNEIKISSEQKRKGYDFAIYAWNQDNTPRIMNGDLLYFKYDKNIKNKDIILFLLDEIPYIREFKENNGSITLKSFSNYYKTTFYNVDVENIKVLGRLVEINSYIKKGVQNG